MISKVLEDALPRRVVELQRDVERGRLHPSLLAELTAQWAAIREAAQQWSTFRASADGSAEVLFAEVPAKSQEIDTKSAADLLGVSTRWVRQLASEGALQGRQVGSSWLLDRSSVELRKECNGGKFR